jgi:hypothetical protein
MGAARLIERRRSVMEPYLRLAGDLHCRLVAPLLKGVSSLARWIHRADLVQNFWPNRVGRLGSRLSSAEQKAIALRFSARFAAQATRQVIGTCENVLATSRADLVRTLTWRLDPRLTQDFGSFYLEGPSDSVAPSLGRSACVVDWITCTVLRELAERLALVTEKSLALHGAAAKLHKAQISAVHLPMPDQRLSVRVVWGGSSQVISLQLPAEPLLTAFYHLTRDGVLGLYECLAPQVRRALEPEAKAKFLQVTPAEVRIAYGLAPGKSHFFPVDLQINITQQAGLRAFLDPGSLTALGTRPREKTPRSVACVHVLIVELGRDRPPSSGEEHYRVAALGRRRNHSYLDGAPDAFLLENQLPELQCLGRILAERPLTGVEPLPLPATGLAAAAARPDARAAYTAAMAAVPEREYSATIAATELSPLERRSRAINKTLFDNRNVLGTDILLSLAVSRLPRHRGGIAAPPPASIDVLVKTPEGNMNPAVLTVVPQAGTTTARRTWTGEETYQALAAYHRDALSSSDPVGATSVPRLEHACGVFQPILLMIGKLFVPAFTALLAPTPSYPKAMSSTLPSPYKNVTLALTGASRQYNDALIGICRTKAGRCLSVRCDRGLSLDFDAQAILAHAHRICDELDGIGAHRLGSVSHVGN